MDENSRAVTHAAIFLCILQPPLNIPTINRKSKDNKQKRRFPAMRAFSLPSSQGTTDRNGGPGHHYYLGALSHPILQEDRKEEGLVSHLYTLQ